MGQILSTNMQCTHNALGQVRCNPHVMRISLAEQYLSQCVTYRAHVYSCTLEHPTLKHLELHDFLQCAAAP